MKYDLKDFTIDEKIRLLAGKDFWHTEDFGGRIYCASVSDGPVGLRKVTFNTEDISAKQYDKPSVAYPSTQVLSQTWEPELAYKTGACLADDCIENDVDVLLAPGLNIKRDPLCGRNFEYVSEDPYVAGVFGREYVRGLQDKHVGATVKHFCANNRELTRLSMSSEVDERTLREIYLEPFRIACEAEPWAVMCAYNYVNGRAMAEHKKLYTVLREEFGFGDRLIMSDWGAVSNHTASVKAGLDLEMPYSDAGYRRLKEDFEAGKITEEEIDVCARRVLDFIELCERERALRKVESTEEERINAAQRVAERGIVLLKNNGVLPLSPNAQVALAGKGGDQYLSGAGSSRVTPCKEPTKLVDALRAALPEGRVHFGRWTDWGDNAQAAIWAAADCRDAAIVCAQQIDGEGADRESMRLSRAQEMLILETARINPNTVVILFAGAAVDMSPWIDKVAAVIYAGYPGQQGAEALANILTGKVCPSGKLTETFPMTYEDSPAAKAFEDFTHVHYSEGLLVGYRYYDKLRAFGREGGERVQFPFGFGLSYTSFEYSDLALTPTEEGAEVSFTVKNTGMCVGAEAAQIYVHELRTSVFRPEKELFGFAKVDLAPGEEKRVCVSLDKRAFSFWSTADDCFKTNGYAFEILVGASAEDIRLMGTVMK